MNEHYISALVLLDLSAAFDTKDHNILLSRLSSNFGITDTALSLLSSYLSNRSQSVLINQTCSAQLPLLRGVPQGSVLGPLLFSLYTTPLSELLASSGGKFHFYADDTQIYVSFSCDDTSVALSNLSVTLNNVYNWFCLNRLAVNPAKTEYLLTGTYQQRAKISDSDSVTSFRELCLIHSRSARNLGVIFDSELKFNDHVSAVRRSSYFFIRQLRFALHLTEIQPSSLPTPLSILNLIIVILYSII